MTSLDVALAASIAGPRPPATTRGQVEALGGRREGVRALALMRAGRDPDGALPKTGTDEYRRYRSERRTIERWLNYETGADRQGRKPAASWLQGNRGKVWALSTKRRVRALVRRGSRNRLYATITVSQDTRERVVPEGGAGLFLSSTRTKAFTDPVLAGDFRGAAAIWEPLFWNAYAGGDDIGFEIDDVIWAKVWPDGTREPA